MKPKIEVRKLEMGDPTFQCGSSHTAKVQVSNPTAKSFTYDMELYLDVTKVASSSESVTIPAGGEQWVDFPVVMPPDEGTWAVYLDVLVAGTLIAHYQATEDVTTVKGTAIIAYPIFQAIGGHIKFNYLVNYTAHIQYSEADLPVEIPVGHEIAMGVLCYNDMASTQTFYCRAEIYDSGGNLRGHFDNYWDIAPGEYYPVSIPDTILDKSGIWQFYALMEPA